MSSIQILEALQSGNFTLAEKLFDDILQIKIHNRLKEEKEVYSKMLFLEQAPHEWFNSLSNAQQANYLKLHPNSEIAKHYRSTMSKRSQEEQQPKKEPEKKPEQLPSKNKHIQQIDDGKPLINMKAGFRVQKVKDKYKVSAVGKSDFKTYDATADEIEQLINNPHSVNKSSESANSGDLEDLMKKHDAHQKNGVEEYDSKPAKKIKGESAQDILAKEGSPTNMTGPESGNPEFKDDTFEKDFVAGMKKLADDVKEWKSRKQEAANQGFDFKEKPPTFELCDITIAGTNLFCGNNLGIPRAKMPQLSGTPTEGSPASKLPKTDSGEVTIEQEFRNRLKQDGIKMTDKHVDVNTLKATQTQLDGGKVSAMLETLKKDPKNQALNAPIFISKDGYVLDGHHRWAALLSLGLADGIDTPVGMNVVEVDMKIEDLVKKTNDFADEMGIEQKKAGETTGKTK